MAQIETALSRAPALPRPHIGFLGVGWIGLNRMKTIVEADAVDVAAVADPAPQMAAEAKSLAPEAEVLSSLDQILDCGVDGVVIATPSALHAEQSIHALKRGAAVFCQKPLGRTEAEVARVIEAARAADRLLAVDMSYRFTEGMRRIRDLVRGGELGRIYAADLVFHNAYGPDKAWFYDPASAGGGCLMDLGVHLVDLALWMLGRPPVARVSGGKLFASGEPLGARPDRVEDYAIATLEFASGAVARIACSWCLQAGCDAVISASFYGSKGGAALRNVNGSFYDFIAERYRGTARETLASPPDAWGGRAAVDWAARLAAGEGYDPAVERLIDVHRIVDQIYGR